MVTESQGIQDYDTYTQSHAYKTVPGVVQVPVAGYSPQHRLIRLHGGYGTRTVIWSAERYGRPPILPEAVTTNDDVLLGTVVAPDLPVPNHQAGGFNWSVSGEYTYAQVTPRVVGTDTFPVGSYPFALPGQTGNAKAIASTVAGAAGAILGGVLGAAGAEALMSGDVSDFNTRYEQIAKATYDPNTGLWSWPFLALPPTFSGEQI